MTDQTNLPQPTSSAATEAKKRVRKAALQASRAADTAIAAVARVEALAPQPKPVESVAAAPSPARFSDAQSDAADAVADTVEDIRNMATIATPTEAAEKAQAFFGDTSARFKTAFDKSSKVGEEMVEFAKGNVEAMVASARVAAKAGESLGQEAADYGKRQFESTTAAFKSFASVKSPTELFQLQSDYAKSSFDSAVAEASRFSESMLKLVGEIVQPLSSRYAVAAEKFKATSY